MLIPLLCFSVLLCCLPQLWNTFHPPELVRPTLERTLKTLKLDYVDLYIIELPMAFKVSADGSLLIRQASCVQTLPYTLGDGGNV